MHRQILTIGLLLMAFSTFSQTVELDIHANKLAHFLKNERNSGGERLERNSTYISGEATAQPMEFRHKGDILPDQVNYYFYFKKDSTIDYILYEWDSNKFLGFGEKPKKTQKQISAFIDKYKELYNQVFKIYGQGKSEGDFNDLSKIETGELRKTDTWNPNDSTEIELQTFLRSKYEVRGAAIYDRWYMIRLYVRNVAKAGPAMPLPGEKKFKQLDSTFNTFLSDLRSKNMTKARSNFSTMVINNITEKQLEQLSQIIKLDQEIVVYFAGVYAGLDGTKFLMLKYKYGSNTPEPPAEWIKVLFDEKNKIAGIQPFKESK